MRGAGSAGSGAAGLSTSVTRPALPTRLVRACDRSQRRRRPARTRARRRERQRPGPRRLDGHADAPPVPRRTLTGSAGPGSVGVLARRDVGERRLARPASPRRPVVLGGDERVRGLVASPRKRFEAADVNAMRRPSPDIEIEPKDVPRAGRSRRRPGPRDPLDLHAVQVDHVELRSSVAGGGVMSRGRGSAKSLRLVTNAMRRPSAEIATGLIAPVDALQALAGELDGPRLADHARRSCRSRRGRAGCPSGVPRERAVTRNATV